MKTFIDLAFAGEAGLDDLEDILSNFEWHGDVGGKWERLSIQQYLGLTEEEYKAFLDEIKFSMRKILHERWRNKP